MTSTITATSETAPRLVALDLFAGTGWGVACQWLGIEEHGVEILPEAVASREAAGMDTAYRDVWDGLLDHTGEFKIDYNLLIASPPCQTFSVAGKGAGRKALDDVLVAIERGDYESPEMLKELTALTDDRTALVLTPLAHVYRDRPTYVVFEQVPTVLPVWNACSVVMRELGYSVVTGVLNAEQYGVPQTRKRAILIARLDGVEARMPEPTHSRYYSRDSAKLDEGVEKWVSMAEALGAKAERAGTPFVASKNMGRGMVERYGERPGRTQDEPAFTIRASAGGTEPDGFVLRPEIDSWKWKHAPATTVAGDPRITAREHHFHGEQSKTSLKLTPEEAARFQSYPDGFPFQGTRGKRFLQIGNAVPPVLAEAILRLFVPAPTTDDLELAA